MNPLPSLYTKLHLNTKCSAKLQRKLKSAVMIDILITHHLADNRKKSSQTLISGINIYLTYIQIQSNYKKTNTINNVNILFLFVLFTLEYQVNAKIKNNLMCLDYFLLCT